MEPVRGVITSEQMVKCVRLDQMRTVDEHRGCPYCYGKETAVETGDRARFCDYQPDKDPIQFGFPPGSTRDEG